MVVSIHNLTNNYALAVCSLESACMDLHSDITFCFVLLCLSLCPVWDRVACSLSAAPAHQGGSLFSCLCFPPHWQSTELTDMHSAWVLGLILRPSYLRSKSSTHWATPVLRSLLCCQPGSSLRSYSLVCTIFCGVFTLLSLNWSWLK